MKTQIRRRRMRRLIRVRAVCLSYRKWRIECNSLQSEQCSQLILKENRPTSAVSASIMDICINVSLLSSRGVGGGVTSYIWQSTDVRAEWPPFSVLPVIWLAPFFNKIIWMTHFFLDSYVKGPIFLTSWYMHIFFAQKFFEAACSLGIQ